ncbi:MAG: ABC transporter substrate-binding protein, partial [Elusimicrobiota bacterium]
MKGKIYSITAILVFILFINGCGVNGGEKAIIPQGNDFPCTVLDSLNRKVTIKRAPERIVSLSPDNTEILFALGLGDKIKGVTEYCDFPARAAEKAKIGGFASPNVELIVQLRPDLVVANKIHEKTVKQLENLGITAVAFDAKNINGVLEKIKSIGRISGKTEDSKALVDKMQREIVKVTRKTMSLPEHKKPRVYFEIWHDPLTTGGGSSFLNSVIEAAGGRNIAADEGKDWIQINPEILLKKDPQVVFFIGHFTSEKTRREIMVRNGWSGITAVKNGRLYKFPDENLVVRPGPRVVKGLEKMAEMLHPELFGKEGVEGPLDTN